MGRMDGDGLNMGNEFKATPVGSAMAVESQHDEINRLRREVETLRAANDCLQDERDNLLAALREERAERDAIQTERDTFQSWSNERGYEIGKLQREVDRLRHQTGEGRTQPARSAEVEMYRRALRALIELL